MIFEALQSKFCEKKMVFEALQSKLKPKKCSI